MTADSAAMAAPLLLAEARRLTDAGLFESAEFLLSAAISAIEAVPARITPTVSQMAAELHYLVGKCHEETKELRRAANHYEKSLMYARDAPVPSYTSNDAKVRSTGCTGNGNGSGSFTPEHAIRETFGKLLLRLGDNDRARDVLEKIGKDHRGVETLQALAKIYKAAAKKKLAIQCHYDILKLHPSATETYEELVKLGESPDALLDMVPNNLPWLRSYMSAKFKTIAFRYKDAAAEYTALSRQIAKCPIIMIGIADCNFWMGKDIRCQQMYKEIRQVEPETVLGMDRLALLLKNGDQALELNRLAYDLQLSSDCRPEPYIACARLAELKGEHEKALDYAEKAVWLNKNHAEAYRVQGQMWNKLGSYDKGLVAFQRAHKLEKDLVTFGGMMESFLGLERRKEALAIAKEAVDILPTDARALALVGTVFSHMKAVDKATIVLQKALEYNPSCCEAIIATVALLNIQAKYKEAYDLLEAQVKKGGAPLLYLIRMGEISIALGSFGTAIDCFNDVLARSPENVEARDGLAKTERLINGETDEMDEDSNA